MRHDLGVGLAAKDVALVFKLAAQRGEVLDYSVVHDGEEPVLAQMRMGVRVGGSAVRSPAGVGYAAGPAESAARRSAFGQVCDRAAGLDHFYAFSVVNGDARAVVAAVLKPSEPV